jgi:4-hydroxy-4-methyl-2-oxoglutarate aldolase
MAVFECQLCEAFLNYSSGLSVTDIAEDLLTLVELGTSPLPSSLHDRAFWRPLAAVKRPTLTVAGNHFNVIPALRSFAVITLGAMRETFTSALLSDSLDALGCMDQALPSRIRPLDEGIVMVGRARTALFEELESVIPDDEEHYRLEISFVDSLAKDDVAVFSCGQSGRIAPWGSLLSTAASVRGAAGAVMDGLVRDILDIRAMKFPVFHGGIGPLDSKGRGRVFAVDVPLECGGVQVSAGDLVFGDADGCVVIPQNLEADVLRIAAERLKGERNTALALRAGRSLADVFKEFRIL